MLAFQYPSYLKKTTAVVESLSTTSTRCSVTEITSLLQDSFFCAAFRMVSFGLGSGRECWGPTVSCCDWFLQGVGLHSLSSPQTGLKSWLGWHILEPCGPNLGTNWGPCYSKCLTGHPWILGHSVPGLQ